MVEGHNQNISSDNLIVTPESEPGKLTTWIRSLQQALTVEVDHGFTTIKGRTNIFSSFIRDYLLTCPSSSIPENELLEIERKLAAMKSVLESF